MKESFPNEVRLLEGRKKHIKSPLEDEYFSTTPYKLGETAVKYSAKPEQSKDYLRDVLVEQLRPREQPASASNDAPPGGKVRFLRPASDRSNGPCRSRTRPSNGNRPGREWRRLKSTRRNLISRRGGIGGTSFHSLPGTPSMSIVPWGASIGLARSFIPRVSICAIRT